MIGEAVSWVTIVDATLVRHHPDVYDGALAGHAPAVRQLIEGTLAGLRFVRNRMGHQVDDVDFIHPTAFRIHPTAFRPGADDERITAWTWNPVPEPTVGSLPPRGQAWEKTRYQAYEAHLAGRTSGRSSGGPRRSSS